jgi:hypothetical protein
LFLIIKVQKKRPEAFAKVQGFDCLQFRYVIVALLQIVIGNEWSNVVDVM